MRKTFLALAAIVLLPGAAFAACGHTSAQQQAMSCLEGTQWDPESGTCTPVVTG